MIFRMRYEQAGGHTHIRLFAGSHEGALGKCGDLCMRNEEFEAFRNAATFMQFLPETMPFYGSTEDRDPQKDGAGNRASRP